MIKVYAVATTKFEGGHSQSSGFYNIKSISEDGLMGLSKMIKAENIKLNPQLNYNGGAVVTFFKEITV